MQLGDDALLSSETKVDKASKKRPKSGTRFPKKLPTYLVGFALKGTFDDLVTAQQIICNKQSPQESSNSISSNNSTKMLESEQKAKDDQTFSTEDEIIDENETAENATSKNPDGNGLGINIVPKTQKEIVENNISDIITDGLFIKNIEGYEVVNHSEIIFNAKNYGRTNKESKSRKKKSKTYKNVRPIYNKFKNKMPKTAIGARFEKVYDKAIQNSINSGQVQEEFANISTVVSRVIVLKKLLAKENLLDESDLTSISNDSNINRNDDGSLFSHPLTAKTMSFISNSSGNTLTRQFSSTTLRIMTDDDDYNSINTVKSAVEILPQTPYKRDVLNIAVAVAHNEFKANTVVGEPIKVTIDNITNLENLTSTETLTMDMTDLTSDLPDSEQEDLNAKSDTTMIKKMSSNALSSDDDTYDMARTSSDLNGSCNTLFLTSKSNLLNIIGTKTETKLSDTKESNLKRQTLLQTVLKLEYSLEAPSTSTTSDQVNDVIVTEQVNQSYAVSPAEKGDTHNRNNMIGTVLKKSFNERGIPSMHKSVNLPNQTQIEAMLNAFDISQQRKCSEESRLPSSNAPEIWENLVSVLDVAFKKFEESFTEKIVREFTQSIEAFKLIAQPSRKLNLDLEKGASVVIDTPVSNKGISAQEIKKEKNECLQCNLVQSKTIDQIMLRLSTQGPKIMDSGRSMKSLQQLKKPKLLKDIFEVLKPPAVESHRVLMDEVDTGTVSTITEQVGRFHLLKILLCRPLTFIRDNVFVVTSVPAFFVVLLFVYGLLLLLMKPW